MASRQNRAIYLDGTKRAVERLRRKIEGYGPKLGPDSAKAFKFLAERLNRLTEDTRTQTFVEFATREPAKLDDVIDAVLETYALSRAPEDVEDVQKNIKQYCERLRQSVQFLREAFSTPIFEAPDGRGGLMGPEERLQFLERLGQAAVMIEQFGNTIDQQAYHTPNTRKQHGNEGARTLFTIKMAEAFEGRFGKPHNELVADLADVLFEGVEDAVTGDAVRTAGRRWKKRKLKMPEPKLQVSTSDELKPYEAVIRSVLEGKP